MSSSKSNIRNKFIFLLNWRFWASLAGALLATFIAIAVTIYDETPGRYGPGTFPACLAIAGFYSSYGVMKGQRGRRFTLIALLCLAFIVFIVLGLLSIQMRK